MSDLYDDDYENALKIAAGKHDLVVLHIDDPREHTLPPMGLISFQDLETGQTRWIDTSSKSVQQSYRQHFQHYHDINEAMLQKYGIDHTTITTGEDFVKPLIGIFKRRAY